MAHEPPDFKLYEDAWLVKWKGIARYLGVSIRTAKRYHYDYGMPVFHCPTKFVRALKHEVDDWLIKWAEYHQRRKNKEKRATSVQNPCK